MSRVASIGSPTEVGTRIAARLRLRSLEIERAIYARVQAAVPDSIESSAPEYQAGLREAIGALVDYCLSSIEQGSAVSDSMPPAAAVQGRRAARTGVSLGTVMRRYVAGHTVIGEFVMAEAERSGLSSQGTALHRIRRTQESLLEGLAASIEQEYELERERMAHSPERLRAEIVHRLLRGEQLDPLELTELDYEIHAAWHLALIASGSGAEEVLSGLKMRFGSRLLGVMLDGTACAWLGGSSRPSAGDINYLSVSGQSQLSVAIGEPGRGIDGWCLTHDQARAALGIALHNSERLARYDDVLLAAVLQNETAVRSLRQRYLTPLRSQKDGGRVLRQTLRTYIALDCNATSAGDVLEVGRRAVTSRVCKAERLIERSLSDCLAELDVALRMEALERPDDVGAATTL